VAATSLNQEPAISGHAVTNFIPSLPFEVLLMEGLERTTNE
jgi:hypothetical protein